jgi:hypothetical protein
MAAMLDLKQQRRLKQRGKLPVLGSFYGRDESSQMVVRGPVRNVSRSVLPWVQITYRKNLRQKSPKTAAKVTRVS